MRWTWLDSCIIGFLSQEKPVEDADQISKSNLLFSILYNAADKGNATSPKLGVLLANQCEQLNAFIYLFHSRFWIYVTQLCTIMYTTEPLSKPVILAYEPFGLAKNELYNFYYLLFFILLRLLTPNERQL